VSRVDKVSRVETVWRRIERWLEANAPVVLENLRPGCTPAEIATIEAALGITFPEDVRASYLIHDGQASRGGGLFGAWEFLSLARIRDEWQIWKDGYDNGAFDDSESEPEGPIRAEWWHPQWIPVTHDHGGNHYCLDLAPSPGGTVGQIITMWHDDASREVVARDFTAWLQEVADGLESGNLLYSEEYSGIVDKDEL